MSDAISRGIRAEALLKDADLTKAFEDLRQSILSALENHPIDDDKGAEKLRISLKLLRGVRANLENALRDGKVAAFRLEQEERRKQPVRKNRSDSHAH